MGRLLTGLPRVVWPSIVLGVATRLLLVALTAIFVGGAGGTFVPELASRVVWSVVVCSGVGLGTALAKRRVVAMGIGGVLGAPLAFDLARAARKGAAELIRVAPPRVLRPRSPSRWSRRPSTDSWVSCSD